MNLIGNGFGGGISRLLPYPSSTSKTTILKPSLPPSEFSFNVIPPNPVLFTNLISLALALTLNSPLPSSAIPSLNSPPPFLPPTTPFSQSKNLQVGLENGKIRPCPSSNPGCVSTNPKSSLFAFPWTIPEGSTETAIQRLKEAILKTQKNAKIQIMEDTPNALVSGVRNFPKSRGPVVGILKGFAGLSGAILTQVYAMINSPDQASLIFVVAVGPSIVVLSVMFLVRPVGGHKQVRPSDNSSFLFTYSICLILAAYLLGVLLLEDLVDVNQKLVTVLASILIFLVVLPIVIPIVLALRSGPSPPLEETLLPMPDQDEEGKPALQKFESFILSEVDDEKSAEEESVPAYERHKRMAHLQAKLLQAAAEGAVRVKRRKGPRRGEDFTLMQALVKADFLLIFFSLVLASGSGLTIIDNLGQMCQSLGYNDTAIFVSMISIWNFLGRIGGGYFSEIIVSKFSYPRPVAMAVVQVVMAIGLFYYAMGWPGEIYVVSILIGLGYGAHWAIVPAAVSELFGLKSFGALYNFLAVSSPAGSLIFSGVIASGIYDYYAAQQAALRRLHMLPIHAPDEESLNCVGSICYSLTCGIMSGLCLVAMVLSLIVVRRTRIVDAQLYERSLA